MFSTEFAQTEDWEKDLHFLTKPNVSTLVRICGSCDTPVANHTNDNNVVISYGSFTIECYREWDTIGFSSWYDNFTNQEVSDYVLQDGIATVAHDHSGPETQSGSDLITKRIAEDYDLFGLGADEAPYVSPLDPYSEQAKVDRWSDTTPDICTVTLEQHLTGIASEAKINFAKKDSPWAMTVNGSTGYTTGYETLPNVQDNVIDDTLRNAYVEGNDAFLSVKLLDEELTKKYHNHLLNVFLDKQTGDVRVGSIRLSTNVDGSITARCVNRNCGPNGKRASLTIFPNLATRKDQEDFVWSVVAHGNNHAAAFIRTRDTFHKVHALGCNIDKCNPQAVNCQDVTYSDVLTDAEQLAFLQEHAVHCKDDKCAHVLRIWELTPAPSVEPSLNLHMTGSAA